jgi:cytoskeletal protein CcmA (bactofilin family)/predicted RNA-binding Zn-ribbon protein involved in translation (DUF1610 family)
VIRGLFGAKDSDAPTPPKNQISVVCPECGAAQFEPRLVVSTFCKKCGVHLTIRKKQVIASNVTRSGVGFEDPWAKPEEEETPPPNGSAKDNAPKDADTDAESKADQESDGVDSSEGKPKSASSPDEGEGFGSFLKSRSPGTATTPTAPARRSRPPDRPSSNSPPPTPPPPPVSASTLQKMKDLGMYRNQYFKDAECFECGHTFKVGRSSRSTQCPQCGSYISMEDVEVNMPSSEPIKTRGDVIVRKRGHITTSEIHCKDLKCQGLVEANIFCSADAIFSTDGTIIGEVKCRRLIIEKGADVTFMNQATAEEIDVHARVSGSVKSSGPVVIHRHGSINGDVTARSVSIEPGGELNGAMNIVQTPSAKPIAKTKS